MGEGLKKVAKLCGGLRVTARGQTVDYDADGNPKLPKGFGDDAISRRMKRNAEPFEDWYNRNRSRMSFDTVASFQKTLRAAYDRTDL